MQLQYGVLGWSRWPGLPIVHSPAWGCHRRYRVTHRVQRWCAPRIHGYVFPHTITLAFLLHQHRTICDPHHVGLNSRSGHEMTYVPVPLAALSAVLMQCSTQPRRQRTSCGASYCEQFGPSLVAGGPSISVYGRIHTLRVLCVAICAVLFMRRRSRSSGTPFPMLPFVGRCCIAVLHTLRAFSSTQLSHDALMMS